MSWDVQSIEVGNAQNGELYSLVGHFQRQGLDETGVPYDYDKGIGVQRKNKQSPEHSGMNIKYTLKSIKSECKLEGVSQLLSHLL